MEEDKIETIWYYDHDWYIQPKNSLTICMNTKEAAEILLALMDESDSQLNAQKESASATSTSYLARPKVDELLKEQRLICSKIDFEISSDDYIPLDRRMKIREKIRNCEAPKF